MYRKPESFGMAKSYYSTIFEHPADHVRDVIRDFNNYPVWVDGAGESEIESGKSGDSVGAVRNVLYEGRFRAMARVPAASIGWRRHVLRLRPPSPFPGA